MLQNNPQAWHRPEAWQIDLHQEAYYAEFISNVPADEVARQNALDMLCRAMYVADDAAAAWALEACCNRWDLLEPTAAHYRALIAGVARRLRLPNAPALDVAAQHNRRGALLLNEGLVRHDAVDARLWEQAANAFEAAGGACAAALNNLGFCVERGLGRSCDLLHAQRLYEAAIAQGSLVALDNLAAMRQHGLGCEMDMPAAVSLLRQAIARGDVLAGHALAYLVLTRQVPALALGNHRHDLRRLMLSTPGTEEVSLEQFELRNVGPGRSLTEAERQALAQEHHAAPWPHWKAPLSDCALLGEETARCPHCAGDRHVLEAWDTGEQATLGCLSCLAAGAFINPNAWEPMPAHRVACGDSETAASVYPHLRQVLQHTPSPVSGNSHLWPVHCEKLCNYLGSFSSDDFHYRDAGGEGLRLFRQAAAATGTTPCTYEEFSPGPGRQFDPLWLTFSCDICAKLFTFADLT